MILWDKYEHRGETRASASKEVHIHETINCISKATRHP